MSTPVHSIQEVDALGTKRRYHNKQSLCYIIRSGVAGGVAGCVAKTVIAPLDRVKILFQASNPHFQKYAGTWSGAFQASKEIYTINGVRGLFQGNSATLLRILPYAAIKFVAFEQIRHVLMPNEDTAFRHLISGSLAGITSVLCTYPLELIRVRLAFEVRNDSRVRYVTLFKQIYHESAASHRKLIHFPIMNFYRGLNPTIIGMIPYAGVSFFTHYLLTEFCRTELADSTTKPSLAAGKLDSRGQNIKSPLKTWAELTVGGLSGAIAQTVSYPLEVIRRRMQVYGAVDPTTYVGLLQTIRTIWVTNGFKGFFVGLSIGYLKVTPMVAVSFTVYHRMKLLLNID
ncbi:mitochondrial carrier [Rhizophagus irregularis]|uniref:Mitochondrial carrier n=3 Tax=Rhizophagus irregularis TaxID=588596 RepID=A0A2I1DY66_9GLOM|nr:mitochondrial carrier domain-containing protein [Rhizophagus irregularis DAOM 181602=DAOM 197198]EXX59087.1 Leu5p [Rhizophagus irregularis DAOM 197198w]PKC08713.1 mitochondrial carrier [Rhizophagus irregularis]PKC68143.1 mitochondrial carrier [Rhizophagus irregularis]PKK67109.1 mitochondrial carrier [Rhizophagus irregularis]PKY14815.1 mitochondrial carrier [Rhizophagus irregularis]|eukprot:XP_025188765.1 mitochondrial carrier domain-containing protein [Rhizophagus irregularis DAOM 181602=DAOM 197198]